MSKHHENWSDDIGFRSFGVSVSDNIGFGPYPNPHPSSALASRTKKMIGMSAIWKYNIFVSRTPRMFIDTNFL